MRRGIFTDGHRPNQKHPWKWRVGRLTSVRCGIEREPHGTSCDDSTDVPDAGRTRGGPLLPASVQAAIDNLEPLKVTRVDAVTFREGLRIGGGSGGSEAAEFCWVRLHTDKGIVGTGETYPFHQGEIGALKDHARQILGPRPAGHRGHVETFYHAMAMRNAGGADMRIFSAINMAQLDILGQASGLPLYRLLGGKTRPRVRVYNTTTDYWAINNMKMGARHPGDRAVSARLWHHRDEDLSLPTRPTITSPTQALDRGLSWIREIRDKVGDAMDICVDCWGRFDFTSAKRIAKALEPYNIMYLEDAMLPNNAQAMPSWPARPACPSA